MMRGNFGTSFSYRMPQVYRYMDEKYVDLFLSSGELMIGSYDKFRKDDHEERGDSDEGRVALHAYFKNNFAYLDAQVSNNAYVLCTSTIFSEEIQNMFNENSCFVIADVMLFADQVARNIPGCHSVLVGACNYNGWLEQHYPHIDRTPETEIQFHQLSHDACRTEPYFHKSKKYFPQAEFRFVFLTDRPAQESLLITSTSAARFCKKVNHLSSK